MLFFQVMVAMLILVVVVLLAAMAAFWTLSRIVGVLFKAKTLDDFLINLGVLAFMVGVVVVSMRDTPPDFLGWHVLLSGSLLVTGLYIWEHRQKRALVGGDKAIIMLLDVAQEILPSFTDELPPLVVKDASHALLRRCSVAKPTAGFRSGPGWTHGAWYHPQHSGPHTLFNACLLSEPRT